MCEGREKHRKDPVATMKTILVGGTHLDFGWALQFIARARYKAQPYIRSDRVIVACEETFHYLFEDFAHGIELYPVKTGQRDRWLYKGKAPMPPKEILKKYKGAKLFYPNESRCKRKEAKWVKYGQMPLGPLTEPIPGAILIHARNLPKVGYDRRVVGGSRNWSTEKWEELVRLLDNPMIVSVGSKSGARHIDQTIDGRGKDLRNLCRLMAVSSVLVGESSGPHHLNALCGGKSVVWTHKHKEKSLDGKTNRWRYEEGWNPFKSPVTVLDDGWDPQVSDVLDAIKGYL